MTSSSRPEAAGTVLTEITAPDFSEARSCAVETAKPDDDVAERENLPDGELAPGGAAAVEQLDKPACPHETREAPLVSGCATRWRWRATSRRARA